jgi:hypothetical protein
MNYSLRKNLFNNKQGKSLYIIKEMRLGYSIDLGFLVLGYHLHSIVSDTFCNEVSRIVKPTHVLRKSKKPIPLKIIKVTGDLKRPEFNPGNLVLLTGYKLWFKKSDLETRVFLRSQNGETIRVNQYLRITREAIFFKLPTGIAKGENIIEVRRRKSNGQIVKGLLGGSIVVA